MKRDKQELMRKVKALAEQGFGGEQENAKKLLKKLIAQYGPIETDEEERTRHDFRYHDELERRLLNQVIYAVTGNQEIYTLAKKRKLKMLGVYCTKREAIDIETQFVFYSAHMKKELEIFIHAFVQTNDIFPPGKEALPVDDMDVDKIKEAKRMFSMMQGMVAARPRKMIEG